MDKCMCVYCQRTAKVIAGSVENKQKSIHTTKAAIMFVDSHNRLSCGRCVSELDLVLAYGGEPVLAHYPKRNVYATNTGAIARAVKTPVATDDLEAPLTLREVEA